MILRLLCALGFHRAVVMEKLWLNSFEQVLLSGPELRWHVFRALFCSRCGAQCEDAHGYHNIGYRLLRQ